MIKRLKITVSHINIFLIPISVLSAKIGIGRIISYRTCDRIRQLSTRIDSSGQHISDCMPAFHSTLPYIEHSLRAVSLHPFHVYNISNV